MAIATVYGTGTINSTLGAGGIMPSVTYTATLTHTTSYWDGQTPLNTVRDVMGIVGISATRLNDTTVQVSADRQIPAGEEIVFSWVNINGSA